MGVVHVLQRRDLEAVLGFTVASWPGSYVTAFTHPSAARYFNTASYERLEYLGDSVIGFVVASWLFQNFPAADEGMMTQMRTRLVSGETLAKLAGCLGLGQFVMLSPRAAAAPRSSKVLADVFEALVGAVYLDSGMLAAKEFVLNAIGRFVSLQELLTNRNFKDQLLQACHKLKVDHPRYDVVGSECDLFVVQVVAGGRSARGSGKTKKDAEQAAAWRLLMGYST